jgi:putative tricarboxylic transport membrane protein
MKKNDQISSVVWLLAAIYICFESLRLPIGSWRDPGPGFLPLGAGLLLGILSIIVFLQASLNPSNEPGECIFPRKAWGKMIFCLAALLGYALILPVLGFLVTTYIFLFLLFRFGIEAQSWVVSLAGSALASLLCYGIFEMWLKTQLPKGIIGF